MLSRTADHLYWMARYLERTEGLARMLDAHHRLSLIPRSPEEELQGWAASLISLGTHDEYLERHGTITSDLWETLNSTYLDSRALDGAMPEDARGDFLDWVKYRSHLTRGVTTGTMPRDEALSFMRIGTYLERADNTTRLLEARWRDPGGRGERLIAEASEWAVLLRAMSAFETYRRVRRSSVTPRGVTDLFLMREDLPQAVHRCLAALHANLQLVANDQSIETLRCAGEMHAQFRFGSFEALCAGGVTPFLDGLQLRLRTLGVRIARDFLVPLGGQ